LRCLLISISFGHKFANLWSERLLALIRRACKDDAECERIASVGFLAQIMSAHVLQGGDDPRSLTRRQLLEDGVALKCSAKLNKTDKPQGIFSVWMTNEEGKRKTAGIKLSREQYRMWQHQKVLDFNALPLLAKQDLVDVARKKLDDRQVDEANDGVVDFGLDRVLPTVVNRFGDKRTPVPPEVFRQRVREKLGIGVGDIDPGFTRYEGVYRQEQIGCVFCKDVGDIPRNMVMDYTLPCPLAHPEVCATADAEHMVDIHGFSKSLHAHFTPLDKGNFYCLKFAGPENESVTFIHLNFKRGGGPKLLSLSPCVLREESLIVQIDDGGDSGEFEYLVERTLMKRLVTRGRFTDIYCSPLPEDAARNKILRSATQVALLEDWRLLIVPSFVRVHPRPKKVASTNSKDLKGFAQRS
jgi:hypothetical protein